jgi:hypothetical protein
MMNQSTPNFRLILSLFIILTVLSGCGLMPSADKNTKQKASVPTVKPGHIYLGPRIGTARLHPLNIFGGSKSAPQAGPIVYDPDYAEYTEWKRWQEFKAYQQWKAGKESQAGS